MVLSNKLQASDGLSRRARSTRAPGNPALRGLDFIDVPSSNDSITISADRRTLTMTFEVQNIMDEVRVVTQGDTIEGNGVSERPDLSGDGRYVAFQSQSSNLVPGDVNGTQDVFLRDLHSTPPSGSASPPRAARQRPELVARVSRVVVTWLLCRRVHPRRG